MRWALIILGLILILIGAVWVLQGSGILPGSFMTGDPFWARVGAATLIGGAVLVGAGLYIGRDTFGI